MCHHYPPVDGLVFTIFLRLRKRILISIDSNRSDGFHLSVQGNKTKGLVATAYQYLTALSTESVRRIEQV